ncbi:Sugar lactone lactonase YvrE [Pseudooceanicola antarcticus]|uniref:Gluconolactonase n=1 Tax=Pseudooceanicola antarcticus TaxID=1247613 RepID=A0A285IPU5_9RHOB|nr:SMP-30/gluconolactonase/LRE family protein [Pseudooceanicola antarcticus]PJE31427.1 gluconolactonase [Pseudooceanicola antarcticus]SNY50035.1 Sugar lactone lactonase YvrE [Pseudooceanicola antarcticus]
MTRATLCDSRNCELGEGPLWHPLRGQLFWFDIIGRKLLSIQGDTPLEWSFDEYHSAAGWVDETTLILASETALWRFDIETGAKERLVDLEADNPVTRSNDGRADPQGGFWIGTMGKAAEPGAGAIYRYYKGELRKLWSDISISNAICFSPDGKTAYFADTPKQTIMRVALDAEGWPGTPELFIDLAPEGLFADGAVVDSEGYLWNAQWGAGRVARYAPDGSFDRAIAVDGLHTSCPAFGGPDLTTLYATTAREGISTPDAAQGRLYQAPAGVAGQREHQVVL